MNLKKAREAAIAKIRACGVLSADYHSKNEIEDDIVDMLECVPAADVSPVAHGRWIRVKWVARDDPDGGYWIVRCSICSIPNDKESYYCPNCGAKMDGGGE